MPNTSYDLISINGVALPDIQKGTLSMYPQPKYTKYEGEEGNKIIDVVSEGKLTGTVTYSGLFQSQMQTVMSAYSIVSTFTIYNPFTGNTKTFKALVVISETPKIIHDGLANAWQFGFTFEEIDDVEVSND